MTDLLRRDLPSRGGPSGDLPGRDLPSPAAARLARPRWLEPRLLAGLLLVLLSIVVGARVFAAADERVRVWSVTHDLGADSRLTDDDLAVRAVRLDDLAGRYVGAEQDPRGRVLTHPVSRGELLPVAAVARTSARPERRVVVEVDRLGAGGLTKGRVVDVYAVRDPTSAVTSSGAGSATGGDGSGPGGSAGTDGRPQLVLSGVTVAEDVRAGDGGFASSGAKAGVPLLVAVDDVSALIDAMAHGDVYVVQVPASGTP
jgi:hypothetical protein